MRPEIEVHCVAPFEAFWEYPELPSLVMNQAFDQAAERLLAGRRVACVYQRYSLNNYAGLRLARRLDVPLVIEYNGSEIWMGRHWGRPLKHEALSRRIEELNLSSADLIDQYSVLTGGHSDRLAWYLAFAYFKLAAIFEGIHYRFVQGQTVGDGFDRIGALVGPMTEAGHRELDRETR